jgi:hypothetical protein
VSEHGRLFWAAAVIGGALVGFGVQGALTDAATHPPQSLVWLVGADLVHDLVLAPFVGLAGYVLARAVREPWRTPVRSGLVVSGIAALIAWPAWRGYGRDHVPDNPSVLPLDYTSSIFTVLVAIWAIALLWAITRVRHTLRSRAANERDGLVE